MPFAPIRRRDRPDEAAGKQRVAETVGQRVELAVADNALAFDEAGCVFVVAARRGGRVSQSASVRYAITGVSTNGRRQPGARPRHPCRTGTRLALLEFVQLVASGVWWLYLIHVSHRIGTFRCTVAA